MKLTYSIAIRTLGQSGEKFRKELWSIVSQTVQPDKVLVYIAEGYPRPDYTIGMEEYVWVKKGMMSQRILSYDEISSDCIMMLDDDVCLSPDSAERMLSAMERHNLDCVGADTFKNHRMSTTSKLYSILTNFVFPHYSDTWAFKIHRNGSFSYNNNPVKSLYLSHSCAGPASIWKKTVYKRLCLEDELWLEDLDFPYGEDVLFFHKLYLNGFRLGILFDSGVVHLDGSTSSGTFRNSPNRIYIRTKASFMIWWRTCYDLSHISRTDRFITSFCFIFKSVWLLFVMLVASVVTRNLGILPMYIRGLIDGWKFVHTPDFISRRNYIVS